ncbi:MAG: glucose-6-phosphate isomerase [Candidatus Planktophila sp.]|nr:glucose-6-phosphate isomerase [Candidatus Planktophila sp.]
MRSLSGRVISQIDRSDPRYVALLAFHNRLALKDPSMWGLEAQAEAILRLNWIDLPETSRELLPQLDALSAKHRDKLHVVLCGMGGSSLGPEVIAKTFKRKLFVLDSTDPNYISHALTFDLNKTLVIVSSKSGSTIETASQRAFFEKAFIDANLKPTDHIIIVTDPDSPLDKQARAGGFTVVNADPQVGGRFSALSAFGLVPASLIGVDVSVLLDNASETKAAFLKDSTFVVDMAYAISYLSGQYMSYSDSGCDMPGLSDWAEQLVAESTGKNQVGRLPIVVEEGINSEFFSIAFYGVADLVLETDLASQFIIWEWVTALVGAALGIDPFNQPNVTEAKEATAALLLEWNGVLPEFSPDAIDGTVEIFGQGSTIGDSLTRFIELIPEDGYVAIMAYLDRRDDAAILELRSLLSQKSGRPVTFGWGPRFLHSTGQFHKGGQQNGAFLQITGDVDRDYEIPGQNFSFKTLIAAQALGDGRALTSRKYPLLRLNLTNRNLGIAEILKSLKTN